MQRSMIAASSLIWLAACSAPETDAPTKTDTAENTENADLAGSTCPDDGPRFPISGICVGRAINFIEAPVIDKDLDFYNVATAEDCHWEIMETAFATDALLYQGVVCGENKSSLEFAGGGQAAHLYLASSPFGPDMGDLENPVAIIFSADPENPTANVEFRTKEAIEDPALKNACEVYLAPEELGYPRWSYIVDVPEDMRPPVEDGPYAMCGPYGFNGDEASYWVVKDDFSWFFQLGQEPTGVAPESFTLITPEAE